MEGPPRLMRDVLAVHYRKQSKLGAEADWQVTTKLAAKLGRRTVRTVRTVHAHILPVDQLVVSTSYPAQSWG